MSPERKRDRPDADLPMTSTIVLGAPLDAPAASEQPAKRQKRARPGQGKDARFHHTYDVAIGRFGAPVKPTPAAPAKPTVANSATPQSEQAKDDAAPDNASTGPVLRKNKRPSLRLRLAQSADFEAKPRKRQHSSNPATLDFSNAPKDPGEFIWWIAQHITQMNAASDTPTRTDSATSGMNTMTSVMRPLKAGDAELGNPDIIKEREKEKQRVDNRERKKRWRETNAERNKDNDLRCRVTKLARNLFGAEDSEDKREFIEAEFEHRRSKRTQKERARAPFRINLPAFRANSVTTSGLKDALRESLAGGKINGVEAAGLQLIDMLVDSEGQQVSNGMLHAADALRADLTARGSAFAATEEAMRILSGNEDLRKALEGSLQQSKELAEMEDLGSEEDGLPELNGHSEDGGSVPPNPKPNDEQIGRQGVSTAGNIQPALSTLSGMTNDENTPATKQKRPTTLRLTQPRKPEPPKRRKGKARKKQQQNSALLDPSSIDYLLALANGGSLDNTDDSDDEDDVAMTDPEQMGTSDADFGTSGSEPFNQVLERVAKRIITKRLEGEAGSRGRSSLGHNRKAYSVQSVREEVLKLKALLSDSGVSMNMLMPASEARALSQLHSELQRHIESEVGHDAIPEGMRMNGTVYEHSSNSKESNGDSPLGPQQRLDRLASLYLSAMPSGSQSAVVPQAEPSAMEEVERKVRIYGYPPLPGQGFEPKKNSGRGR